jgi:small subunit ribosomal protein S9
MARVRLVPGTGAITDNKRSLDDFFPNNVLKMVIKQPLLATRRPRSSTSTSRVAGGGPRARPARSVTAFRGADPLQPRAAQEAQEGRVPDARPRMKERKKYGQRGARARFQFSKR